MAHGPTADQIFKRIGAIQDAEAHLFAGRGDVIDATLESLEESGAVPVIFGERGIGKSSVAWRIFNILRYKDTNAEFEKIAAAFNLDDSYIPLWVECGDWFSGIESALLALLLPKGLRQAVTIADLFPDLLSAEQRARAEATFELNIALFKASLKLGTVSDREAIAQALRAATDKALADPIEMFSQVGARLISEYPQSTLIVFIDEFDRLPDKSMVGSILKTLSRVRFVIVGVGKTSSELIGSHQSVDRKIINIEVPVFTNDEAMHIFDNAEKASLAFDGSKGISFSNGFKDKIIQDTGGYPNLIQKVGYYCVQSERLYRKMFDDAVRVKKESYLPSLEAMFKSKSRRGAAEDEVETRLAEATMNAPRRTEVIRAMVRLNNEWSTLSEFFPKMEKKNHQNLQGNLDTLVTMGVFMKDDEERYKFSAPLYFMASSLLLEAREAAEKE